MSEAAAVMVLKVVAAVALTVCAFLVVAVLRDLDRRY